MMTTKNPFPYGPTPRIGGSRTAFFGRISLALLVFGALALPSALAQVNYPGLGQGQGQGSFNSGIGSRSRSGNRSGTGSNQGGLGSGNQSGQFGGLNNSRSSNRRGSQSEDNDSRRSRRSRRDNDSNDTGRTSRRESRRDREKNTQSATPTPAAAGAPARAAAQGRSAVPQNLSGGAGKSSRKTVVVELPTFNLSEDIVTDTLYFSPSEATAEPGERFSTPLFFYNSKARAIDAIDIWLHYDPQLLDPASIDTSAIKGEIDGEMTKEVWRAQGYVHLQGRFDPPLKQLVQQLASISWTAGEMAAPAEIAVEPPQGKSVGVYEGETNCLELSGVGNRGLVTMPVKIQGEEAFGSGDDRPFQLLGEGEDPFAPERRTGLGAKLGLLPRDEQVRPGEISTIDVVLINPDVAEFDELRFRVRFDPDAVQILDADENNYITNGVNVYDGGFHPRMPFDRHEINEADQASGSIDYAAQKIGGVHPYASGTVARIVFRMKRDAGAAAFWFEAEDPLTGRLISDVRARGRSLLGDPGTKPSEALYGAEVFVQPI